METGTEEQKQGSTNLWTLSRVAKVIELRFGVVYNPGYIWYIRSGLSWSTQKPEARPHKRHEEAIESLWLNSISIAQLRRFAQA